MKTHVKLFISVVVLTAVISLYRTPSKTISTAPQPINRVSGLIIGTSQSSLTQQLGLQEGDILLKVNGAPFTGSFKDFDRVREQCLKNQQVSFVFHRDGKTYKRLGHVVIPDAKPNGYEFGAYLLGTPSTPRERSETSLKQ